MNAMRIHEARRSGERGTPALVVEPDGAGPYPCVVLLHERYGLVPHTEDLARKIAAFGYVVIAPDLFYTHPDQAGLHAGTITAKPPDAEVLALLEDVVPLFAQASADPARLGMIGVCQTGRYPFVWGAAHPLRACIALYGAAQKRDWVVNDHQPDGMEGLIAKLDADVLGIFGEKDHIISFDDVIVLRESLERNNRSYDLSIYADVPHGWLNDTMPGRYRPQAAQRALGDIVAFLDASLAPAGAPSAVVRWNFNAVKSSSYNFTKNVRME